MTVSAEVDYSTSEDYVSWQRLDDAARSGADRVILSGAQIRLLTGDLAAILSGRCACHTKSFGHATPITEAK